MDFPLSIVGEFTWYVPEGHGIVAEMVVQLDQARIDRAPGPDDRRLLHRRGRRGIRRQDVGDAPVLHVHASPRHHAERRVHRDDAALERVGNGGGINRQGGHRALPARR